MQRNGEPRSRLYEAVIAIIIVVGAIWGLYSLTHSHGQPPAQTEPYSCWQGGCSGQ